MHGETIKFIPALFTQRDVEKSITLQSL